MEDNETKLQNVAEVEETEGKELVEVKEYKKANSNLLKNVVLAGALIAIMLSVYTNVLTLRDRNKANEEEPEVIEEVQETKAPSKSNGNNGGNGNQKPAEQKPAEQKPAEQKPAEQKPAQQPAEQKPAEPTTPQEVINSWTTEVLPAGETITFAYYDKAETMEDKLTAADKAYIQEYMDYYGISYEDARVNYLQFGPLQITVTNNTQNQTQEVEYETVYVFDADDLATINEYVNTLGMTRAEAEEYYVTVTAPALGKPIQTEIKMKLK